jgi:hypothetical protein
MLRTRSTFYSKTFPLAVFTLVTGAALAACSDDENHPLPAFTPPEPRPIVPEDNGDPGDAAVDAPAKADAADAADAGVSKAALCTGTFGKALSEGFGRLDGTLLAVVTPADKQCPLPNSDHVILEITMGGAVYRMVINVQSDRPDQDPRVSMADHVGTLPPPAWAEGWHGALTFDYVTQLGLHDKDFAPYDMAPLVDKIAAPLVVGAKISVYATVGAGRTDSAHLVHRNGTSNDGAIVIGADSAQPRFFAF